MTTRSDNDELLTAPPSSRTNSAVGTASAHRPPLGTLDELRQHLQWAIELEHATLPPYLCALYSLDEDTNPEASSVLGGIFVEEMIHLALAANILNAVGGQPRLDTPTMLPPFPRPMPHGDRSLMLSLVAFGPDALDTFLRIEQPAAPGGRPEADGYETIGQFYAAISEGLRRLCDQLGERAVFCGDAKRQVTAEHFRHSAARLLPVDSLDTALAALAEIVDQGEGAGWGEIWDGDADIYHPDRREVAHYYRFLELKLGRRFQSGDTAQTGPTGEAITVGLAGVRPMRSNPRLTDHPAGSPIRAAQQNFNAAYCRLLNQLEQAFNGAPGLLRDAGRAMYVIKVQAEALMQLPDGPDQVAGPTFDYVPPALRG